VKRNQGKKNDLKKSNLPESKVKNFILQMSSLAFFNFNRECHAAKGKQTCSCFEAQLKFLNFFL